MSRASIFSIVAVTILLFAFQWNKRQRNVMWVIPDDIETPAPLIIALHPHGVAGGMFAQMSGLKPLAKRDGVVIAFPSAYIYEWNDGAYSRRHEEDDTRVILDIIEEAQEKADIDLSRVYLVGYSNGAMMALRAASEAPETFAGVASISGTMIRRFTEKPTTPLDVLIVHGTDDRTIKMTGGIEYMSTQQIAQYWAKVADCDDSVFDEPMNFSDRLSIITTENCEHIIESVVIQGMGHNWSDNVYNTPERIWEFFGLRRQD